MTVTPTAYSQNNLCSATEVAVTIANNGIGALQISAMTLSGTGWTMPHVALPTTVDRDATLTFILRTTGGDGSLLIKSNDPTHPALTIPLHSTMMAPPVVKITSPVNGAVVTENADVELEGSVTDASVPAPQLSIEWSSSTAGVLSKAPASALGTTTFSWAGLNRAKGSQSVTLKATNVCGASASATVTFCQDSTFTYSPFDLQGWQYAGQTMYDTTNNWLQITNATTNQEGAAFETSKTVSGDNVDITFQFYCYGGTGADGFALVALDASQETTLLGATGCGMGFGADESCSPGVGLPGWAVEVDTYYNSEVDQTSSIHTAFAFDGDLRTEPIWSALPNIRDGNWHDMTVNVSAPHVLVTIDGVNYLDSDVTTGNFSFPAYVGFTGSTGGNTDNHFINSLTVTGHTCMMTSQ